MLHRRGRADRLARIVPQARAADQRRDRCRHVRAVQATPVPVATPWYHPGGAFAAGAVMGGVAGAAAASAARPATTTVYNYGQPPTVVNNYYGN